MNEYGYEVINTNEKLVKEILSQKVEEEEMDSVYLQTIIMAKFKIAKCFSKILPDNNISREENLIQSLETYFWVKNFIE